MDLRFCVCYQLDDGDIDNNSVSIDTKTTNISHQRRTRKAKKNKMKNTQFKNTMMEQ